MLRLFTLLFFACFASTPAWAWNAAGHRLIAVIAWRQLGPDAQAATLAALRQHPDFERWRARARSDDGDLLLAEAATWPDDLRNDPRFYEPPYETPTSPLPGLGDMRKHKAWHYMDLDEQGEVRTGEIESQIDRLSSLLRCPDQHEGLKPDTLPWLAHLIGDIHQPLHVGRHGDDGGNALEIENPFNARQPFTKLHTFWDDLPGPPWLRGKRLREQAEALPGSASPPPRNAEDGKTRTWRRESHALLAQAYPKDDGSLLPLISERFLENSRQITRQRLVAAGYRLGRLLERRLGPCTPQGTE